MADPLFIRVIPPPKVVGLPLRLSAFIILFLPAIPLIQQRRPDNPAQ